MPSTSTVSSDSASTTPFHTARTIALPPSPIRRYRSAGTARSLRQLPLRPRHSTPGAPTGPRPLTPASGRALAPAARYRAVFGTASGTTLRHNA
ncbi:hypothetical protein Kpho01_53240 [Kitasatospora phosalacinea]|uniref:Uncharacterized protein n=1 Tax=Kitasatospora phosalacinea TaxID=2065 RepID=A0A9W6URA5_9ACTN|nr:hypothetical protein Kpho01_53240 [Kitasatospora phosalacinea]